MRRISKVVAKFLFIRLGFLIFTGEMFLYEHAVIKRREYLPSLVKRKGWWAKMRATRSWETDLFVRCPVNSELDFDFLIPLAAAAAVY